ncbi:hypothetical protein, partial [Bartonella grahamii]|uniref:hypothetical protein n=1 Tax=Bartonella grahamii TaxID=33045 RepID=UPI001ABB8B67
KISNIAPAGNRPTRPPHFAHSQTEAVPIQNSAPGTSRTHGSVDLGPRLRAAALKNGFFPREQRRKIIRPALNICLAMS